VTSAQPQERDAAAERSRKRAEIVIVGTETFAAVGYASTRWTEIADAVGLRQSSLYHYFDSKKHLLFVIMAEAVTAFDARFHRLASARQSPAGALRAILEEGLRLTETEIQRNRVFVAAQGLLCAKGELAREERARLAVRARVRDLEFDWATLLVRGMEQGAIPEADPRLLTRTILGLYGSIWTWFPSSDSPDLPSAAAFLVDRVLGAVFLEPQPAPDAALVSSASSERRKAQPNVSRLGSDQSRMKEGAELGFGYTSANPHHALARTSVRGPERMRACTGEKSSDDIGARAGATAKRRSSLASLTAPPDLN
jgi:TetR/AcrR family transcriptional regulator, cholesterol catabolism regulator